MKAEHVTLIRGMGLYQYLQKGYPLPPSSFLKDYQHLLKYICLKPQTRLLSDKSYSHNCKTPISIYENQNMSKSGKSSAIVVFDDSQNNGDMTTLGKRGKKYMNQVKKSGMRLNIKAVHPHLKNMNIKIQRLLQKTLVLINQTV
jgi:hypothetical protein